MAEYKPKFHDPDVRVVQSGAMTETLILGDHSGETSAGTMLLDKANVSRPMLGRYELDSEGDRLRYCTHYRCFQDQDRHGVRIAIVYVARAIGRQ